jgi:O-antigen ligase
MRTLKNIIIGLLLLNVVTPLLVWMGVVFPFIFPKAIFSRSLIEMTLIVALIYAVLILRRRPVESVRVAKERIREILRNPLIVALGLFFISLLVSTFLAVDQFRAFWGSVERAEGFWGMLHVLLFFILGAVFLSRKSWVLFFKLSLVVGVVVSIRAFIEYLGIFGVTPLGRPDSFVGNAAFLATQMLFFVGFSALVFYEDGRTSLSSWFWRLSRYAVPVLGLLFFVTMFITRTRGALLGFGAGIVALLAYYALRRPAPGVNGDAIRLGSLHFPVRTTSVVVLGSILLFGLIFFFTRTAPVWQSVPGLDRLARTAALDTNDASTQTRLLTWRLSWDAFLERPFFGWGPENYLVAYERHYNPDFAVYGETWLDRAHNKLIDVLVMQGLFGLLSYLAVFGAVLYLIAKLRAGPKALLVALLVAYFVQNLVLFDQLLSYLAFFALLGYILRLHFDEKKPDGGTRPQQAQENAPNPLAIRFLTAGCVLIGLFLLFSLYLWNWVPLVQARLYKGATTSHSVDDIVATLSRAMTPYNFAQTNIRGNAIDAVYLNQFFYNDTYRLNPKYTPLGDILIQGMEDIIARHPDYDARDYIRLVEMMNGYARDDASYYVKAEPLIRKALELVPRRQEVYYNLAFNLAGQGRFEESIQTAQYAVDLNPKVARAHFQLGLMYTAAGDSVNGQIEIARMEELDPSLSMLLANDHRTLVLLYSAWGMTDEAMKLVLQSTEETSEILDLDSYKRALRYYIEQRNADMLIRIATYMKSHFPESADEMDVIVDLANKRNWDILSTL